MTTRTVLVLLLLTASTQVLAQNSRGLFPSGRGGVQILEAYYGSGERLCDATRAVERECSGDGECRVVADNHLCGDPARGEHKSLYVAFECGYDGRRVALARERESLNIYCAPTTNTGGFSRPRHRPERDRIYIEAVDYGARDRYCDATPTFAQYCDGRRNCEVEVSNRLCGDPIKGTPKYAEIEFWCNGRAERGRIRENDVAYLSCP